MNLLIVDDERLIITGLKHIIEQMDVAFSRIDTASHVDHALKMMVETAYDIVITDIAMPDRNGLSLIDEARKRQLCDNFIVLSGYSDFHYAQTALRNGVVDYLLKPVDKQELKRSLRRIWDKRAMEDKQIAHETELLIRDALYVYEEHRVCKLPYGDEIEMLAVYAREGMLGGALPLAVSMLFPGASILKIYAAPMYFLVGKAGELRHDALRAQLEKDQRIHVFSCRGKISTAGELRDSYRTLVRNCLTAAYASAGGRYQKLDYEMALSDILHNVIDDNRDPIGNPYVAELLKYVKQDYAKDINLENLSQKIGLNPAYLGRVFKQIMQMSFSQYLSQYRIHKAVGVLRLHRDWSFEDVASTVGFSEVRNFYRRFKEEAGITPGEFRNHLSKVD